MISDEAVAALLAELEEQLRPMDGMTVLSRTDACVTIRLERIEGPDMVSELGDVRYEYYEPSDDEEEYLSEAVAVAVVVEGERYVYSGFGELMGYDDEGCAGAFDLEVHERPGDATDRADLVARLVAAAKARVATATGAGAEGRALYQRAAIDPFTGKPIVALVNEQGVRVWHAKSNDVVIPSDDVDSAAATVGVEAFDNETADHWIGRLVKSRDFSHIEDAFIQLDEYEDDEFDMEIGCAALIACEVIARLRGRPGFSNATTKRVDDWVAAHPLVPSEAMVQRAVRAIDQVLGEASGLRYEFEAGKHADAWVAAVTALRARLA